MKKIWYLLSVFVLAIVLGACQTLPQPAQPVYTMPRGEKLTAVKNPSYSWWVLFKRGPRRVNYFVKGDDLSDVQKKAAAEMGGICTDQVGNSEGPFDKCASTLANMLSGYDIWPTGSSR